MIVQLGRTLAGNSPPGLLHLDGLESYIAFSTQKKTTPNGVVFLLVDDIGLEPMTFRTSSGCSSQLS